MKVEDPVLKPNEIHLYNYLQRCKFLETHTKSWKSIQDIEHEDIHRGRALVWLTVPDLIVSTEVNRFGAALDTLPMILIWKNRDTSINIINSRQCGLSSLMHIHYFIKLGAQLFPGHSIILI